VKRGRRQRSLIWWDDLTGHGRHNIQIENGKVMGGVKKRRSGPGGEKNNSFHLSGQTCKRKKMMREQN